ncbi:hypothetical protein DUE52_16475 [Larkinella punicea]|uniref:Uncharacterized protein n=1 Tax=Larkinella punicea TaxID=2315727 RepID=A0A368JP28_9BACT|nr:hypothetical protein DUE52_16475 [Larkinella punicea]
MTEILRQRKKAKIKIRQVDTKYLMMNRILTERQPVFLPIRSPPGLPLITDSIETQKAPKGYTFGAFFIVF